MYRIEYRKFDPGLGAWSAWSSRGMRKMYDSEVVASLTANTLANQARRDQEDLQFRVVSAKARKNPSGVEKVKKAIARSKREILKDVADGIVPFGVGSFSQLHNYIDANCYGGLCAQRGYMNLSDANAVQNAVDRWIKAGGIRKGL